LTILGQSLRSVVRRWPVALCLYGVTLLLVLPVVLALRATLAAALMPNPSAEQLIAGFDYTTFVDLMANHKGAIDFLLRSVGPFIFVTIVLHGVFGAGVVAAMAGEGTAAEFLGATGRYLGRSVRLVCYTLLLSLIVLLLWSFAIAAVWSAMTAGDTLEPQYLIAMILVAVLFTLPVAIISLATEYGRVLIVREDRRQVLKSLLEGFRFVFLHPLRMLLQHGSILLAMVLLILLYWAVEGEVGMTSVGGVLGMFLVQQISVFLRIGVRVWNTASAVALVDAVTPEVPELLPVPAVVAPAVVQPAPPEIIQSAPLPVEPAPKQPVRRKTSAPARKPVRRPVRRPRSK
jgi:hypothetical protein